MSEFYLSAADEERLKQDALNNVLLAALAQLVRGAPRPQAFLDQLKHSASKLGEDGTYSDDLVINAYSQNYVAQTSIAFLDMIKISEPD